MQKAGADIIVASLPENIFYISDGYNTMAMDSLLNSECYAVYCASKDKLIYVAPYGDMPTILEHEGTNADLICLDLSHELHTVSSIQQLSRFKR